MQAGLGVDPTDSPAGFVAALRHAVRFQPEIREALASVSAAEARLAEVRSGRLPMLTYDASSNGAGGAALSMGVSQLVYDHGRTGALTTAAKAEIARAEALFWDAVEESLAKAALDYIALSQASAQAGVAQTYFSRASETKLRIDERVAAGAADRSDALTAEIAVSRAASDLDRARAQEAMARAALAASTGTEPGAVEPLVRLGALIVGTGEDSGDAPAVRAATEAIVAADGRLVAAEAARRPPLTLAARQDDVSGDGELWVGFQLSGSFLSGGGAKSRIRAAEAEARAAREALAGERIAAGSAATAARLAADSAELRLAQMSKVVELAQQAAELSWTQYQLNKHPLTSVIDSERQVYTAELDRIAAEADALRARIKALQSGGLLARTYIGSASGQ